MVFCMGVVLVSLRRDDVPFTSVDHPESLSAEQFVTRIKETRYYFIGRNKLRVISKGSHEPELSITLMLTDSADKLPVFACFIDHL